MNRLLQYFLLLFIASNIFSQEAIKDNPLFLSEIEKNPELLSALNSDLNDDQVSDGEDMSIDKDSASSISQSSRFGFDFIDKIPQSISSTSDLPVPNNYQISLGDVLKIILIGGKKSSYTLEVGMDGSILFPDIGAVNVFGEEIDQVRKKINQLVSLTYVGTQAIVSIEQIKARKINIVGAVKNPGTYIVNPFSTITSSLSYSGGFEEYASLRNIMLIRAGKKINFDLYDLLIYGDRESDINIQQGDTILVNSTSKFVAIGGEVLRPFIYEYKDSDTFKKLLIDFALGPSLNANLKNLYAEKIVDNNLLSYSPKLDDLVLRDKLQFIRVFKNFSAKNLDIEIVGNAVQQASFDSKKYSSLEEIINEIKFSDDIYPFYANIEQYSDSQIFREKYSFSISDPDTYQNIKLKRNAKIRFYSRKNIDEIQTFSSDDEILLSQSISRKSLKNLYFSGGKKILPIEGKISPRLIIEFFGLREDHLVDNSIISVSDGSILRGYDSLIEASNINSIFVPKVESNVRQVTIKGLVKSPGIYDVPIGTSLENLYEIAGGILEYADVDSVIFTRQSIKEKELKALESSKQVILDSSSNISNLGNLPGQSDPNELLKFVSLMSDVSPEGRLTGDLSPGSNLSRSLILEEGDVIEINPKRSIVTIIGQVLQPITVSHSYNLDLSDYISLSGGYGKSADKKKLYIIRKNGTSIPVSANLFSLETVIEPGDTIVVPRDFDRISGLPLVSVATTIISDIAFAAASLNSLRN